MIRTRRSTVAANFAVNEICRGKWRYHSPVLPLLKKIPPKISGSPEGLPV
jgi:hypothetical protein